MDAKQLFFERYEGFSEYPVVLLDGMTDDQVRRSPQPGINPIAWILWHVARCEDVGVNRLLVDRPQVFDDGGWSSRLRVDHRHFGTGMNRKDVYELAVGIDLSALEGYRAAVTARTLEVVRALPPEALSTRLSRIRLTQVFVNEGAGGSAAEKIVEAYLDQTRGWLLGHLALTHNFYHIGQAMQVRKMHGLPAPW